MSTQEQVFEYIDALTENLGVATEHVYEALLRQAMVSGITHTAICVISIAVLVVLSVKILNLYELLDDHFESIISVCVLVFSILICVTVIAGTAHAALTAFFNPEYWALKELLNAVKPSNQ